MSYEELQKFYKSSRPGKVGKPTEDPYAATAHLVHEQKPQWQGDRGEKGPHRPLGLGIAPPWGSGPHSKRGGAARRIIDSLQSKVGSILDSKGWEDKEAWSEARDAVKEKMGDEKKEKKKSKKKEAMQKATPINKDVSPELARLLASAIGWATSDDLVRSGGGSPRGERLSSVQSEWDDALRREEQRRNEQESRRAEKRSAAERRRDERRMRRAMRTRKSMDEFPEYENVQKFWSEKSDEYHRKTPVKGGVIAKAMEIVVDLLKDHAPIPPRQGLVWDAVKHKWVRPENHGRTVAEVQGKAKRVRGHGVGQREKKVGGHGGGATRFAELGRRFKGTTDSGTMRPHEKAHPAFRLKGNKGTSQKGRQRNIKRIGGK